jgi:ubiquinone/menaquinone biosynthesis C-methylase UbiE
MSRFVHPALALSPTADERAGQAFVSTLRGFLLNDLAAEMKAGWTAKGRAASDGPAVHRALKGDPLFRFYSAARVKTQQMVWDSVRGTIERERAALDERIAAFSGAAGGSLTLDPALKVPKNVSAIDVHLMPGSYHQGEGAAAGALYENGLAVFSFGLMGDNLDDIGTSIATWLKARHPDFAPADILDLGCSVGHQTLPWKIAYPDARVTGIDVAAPCLRYAHARAEAQGVEAHFVQADACRTPFADASFDLVFSSMFLHELPLKDIRAVFAEAKRLLRPGGLLLHYELPPNGQMEPYDAFYLDWDSHYNAEPYYRIYRDQDPAKLCGAAGFRDFFQAVVPSIGWYGRDAVIADAKGGGAVDGNTGRLADGVRWFTYGAWA